MRRGSRSSAEDVPSTATPSLYRVSIAKDGRVFWSSPWGSRERAEDIRQRNQQLIDRQGWRHVVSVEATSPGGSRS